MIPVLNPSLAAAVETGDVSATTANLLNQAAVPTAYDLGVDPATIKTPKVTLVAVLIDDSGSMDGQQDAVVNGINDLLITPLKGQQSRNDILLCITTMFHGVLLPFTKVSAVEKFARSKFVPNGGDTPLYASVRDTLRLLVDKQGELALSSIGARIMFLAYTDGGENRNDVSASDVSAIVKELDGKKANALYGIACGAAARSSLATIGFKRISDANDPIALADAFNQFSRATSAAAASND